MGEAVDDTFCSEVDDSEWTAPSDTSDEGPSDEGGEEMLGEEHVLPAVWSGRERAPGKRPGRKWRLPDREKVRQAVRRVFNRDGGRELAALRVEDEMLEFVEQELRVHKQCDANREEFRGQYAAMIRAVVAELLRKDDAQRAEEERLRGTLDRFIKTDGKELDAEKNYVLAPEDVVPGRCIARTWNVHELRPLRQCKYHRMGDADVCVRHSNMGALPYGRVDMDDTTPKQRRDAAEYARRRALRVARTEAGKEVLEARARRCLPRKYVDGKTVCAKCTCGVPAGDAGGGCA